MPACTAECPFRAAATVIKGGHALYPAAAAAFTAALALELSPAQRAHLEARRLRASG
ncbi:hypothetical protein Dvina_12495 [Dactylosporangium vinaceum]|uniref:4Fe-4S Wbl-type domain-containing protein n=1 Tax=Dactylosporangium vinaceum TaxID=53362 RepID=A0ABV5MFN8_9ACTN|nr:hypothetical protein [Dactylosporangium vinaceum]UAB98813.1 hypothetical protein Dvina_12495 [Dactylosporangium vinaceum]